MAGEGGRGGGKVGTGYAVLGADDVFREKTICVCLLALFILVTSSPLPLCLHPSFAFIFTLCCVPF